MTTLPQFTGGFDGEGVALSPDHAYTTTERCPAAAAGSDHRSYRPARVRALPRARRTARARCRRLAPRGAGHHRRDQRAGVVAGTREPLAAGQAALIPAASPNPQPTGPGPHGIWMTPLASVAKLEKFALLKIARCRAPVVSNASASRTSLLTAESSPPLSWAVGTCPGDDPTPGVPSGMCETAQAAFVNTL
jgi:hypothetical protein